MATQAPFAATSGGGITGAEEWRSVAFHPAGRPVIFVAATQFVHAFDLAAQKELPRLKLDLSSDRIVTIAVHPTGRAFLHLHHWPMITEGDILRVNGFSHFLRILLCVHKYLLKSQ